MEAAPLQATCQRFPRNEGIREEAGIPWGCLIRPYTSINAKQKSSAESSNIARCSRCYAYINVYVRWSWSSWQCSLCRTWNSATKRYQAKDSEYLPEFQTNIVEYVLTNKETDEKVLKPVYILAIDISGDEAAIDAIKKSLIESIDALPEYARIAFLVFSHRIGFLDASGSKPNIKYSNVNSGNEIKSISQLLVPKKYMKEMIDSVETCLGADPADLKEESNESWSLTSLFMGAITSTMKTLTFASAEKASMLPTYERREAGVDNENSQKSASEQTKQCFSAFGDVLQMLKNLIGDTENVPSTKIIAFITKRPNYGIGKIPFNTATPFYVDIGRTFAGIGTSIDLVIVSKEDIGINSLKFLPSITNGRLMFYNEFDKSSLGKDLRAHFAKMHAFGGHLRIRTSPEFKIGKVYSSLTTHPKFSKVLCLPWVHENTTIAIRCDFNRKLGFSNDTKPVIQFAFEYKQLSSDDAKAEILSRLRVVTMRLPTAKNVESLMNGCQLSVTLTHITHQAIFKVFSGEELVDIQNLLQSWALRLVKKYSKHFNVPSGKEISWKDSVCEFHKLPSLQGLIPLVFALIHSPALRTEPHISDENRMLAYQQYTSATPQELISLLKKLNAEGQKCIDTKVGSTVEAV
mmetsp:Transcript_2788/g.4047  ORF Transcript_2788/g.4047 Transcript_2788/m.4047 type:complete len:634 (+) Transcript_2788:32-1933(+)